MKTSWQPQSASLKKRLSLKVIDPGPFHKSKVLPENNAPTQMNFVQMLGGPCQAHFFREKWEGPKQSPDPCKTVCPFKTEFMICQATNVQRNPWNDAPNFWGKFLHTLETGILKGDPFSCWARFTYPSSLVSELRASACQPSDRSDVEVFHALIYWLQGKAQTPPQASIPIDGA